MEKGDRIKVNDGVYLGHNMKSGGSGTVMGQRSDRMLRVKSDHDLQYYILAPAEVTQVFGLKESDGREFWGFLQEVKDLYLVDCFLQRDTLLCRFCGKEIKPQFRLPNFRQHANIIQSMEGHLKGHIRRAEITPENLGKTLPWGQEVG